MNKKDLTERDICTKIIMPALLKAGWDSNLQIREQVFFTDGKVYVNGRLTSRGTRKFADYILYYKPNIPIAVIEAKDNNHTVRSGIQQALSYADILDIPSVFSTNGDGFLYHDKTIKNGVLEKEISLNNFPSPEQLWQKYKHYKNIQTPDEERIAAQEYFIDSTDRKPRYYQQIAINRTVEAIAKGQNRVLLVMATGTGKTYTAFQIIHRLWKSGAKKRILFLADRNALISQTKKGDFKHFNDKMTVVKHRQIDKSYEIYLALYQGLSGNEESANVYKQFSPSFFDLIIIDECHRGSAAEDSSWREILTYFHHATHIGLTATPKETMTVSNSEYFGDPLFVYSLKQGIEDGFLAPYRVFQIALNIDIHGWRPEDGKLDKSGKIVEDRLYNRVDYDRNLVIDERTDTVARKITEFLKGYDRFAKTIVFCTDIDHAERMRTALANYNADLVAINHKYVMQITGDNEEGKRELDNFTNPEEKYPVIATTSELMTTGIDAQTCKVIVLDAQINSMTKFKQIIGRGTRINEEYGKLYFTILDFRNVTDLVEDPAFNGNPLRVKPMNEEESLDHIIDDEQTNLPVVDDEGIEITWPSSSGGDILSDPPPPLPREKVYVNGIDVSLLSVREVTFDSYGNKVVLSLQEHTKKIVKEQCSSLDDFLHKWQSSERKQAVIQELQAQGVLVDELYDAVGKQIDLFDIICHVVYDQPPLTRKERAMNVKKRHYFSHYGEQATKVLEALLEKYADQGIENIENIQILTVPPLNNLGTVTEIIKTFGSREEYEKAIKDLESELYKVA
ncbi:MAG: EcoAI/FtnUII family type I restriction enzme subunit R [Candidatus Kapaibacterium sp.]|jgi:type I restriction enzyme R subunit